jgi:hypothetical protein
LFDHKALDISIDIATHGTKEPMAGTVGMVGGHVMLTKGLKLQPGYEIDALDAPVLSMRLVMILLKRVFPKGPEQIVGPTDVDQTERVGIKYATPSASGYIAAPWHVKGTVSRLADGTLPFELALSFPLQQPDKQTSSLTINMKGELDVLGRPVFRDTDSLEGWTTYGLGPQQTKQGSSTILDYGAEPQEDMRYRTIGDIRAFIAAENHPGVRDATKDFTGYGRRSATSRSAYRSSITGTRASIRSCFADPAAAGTPRKVASHLSQVTRGMKWSARAS